MTARFIAALLRGICLVSLAGLACPVAAQTAKKIVTTQDDLPRYSYPIALAPSALLVADDATFAPFAAKVRADVDATLAGYDVEDRATLRGLLRTRMALQMLAHDDTAALQTIARIRALEDKPDAKLVSGRRNEAIVTARIQSGQSTGPAFEAAYIRLYGAALAPLPWSIVGTALKEQKSSAQISSTALLQGDDRATMDPGAAKLHTIGDDFASQLVLDRLAIRQVIPTKAETVAILTKIVSANTVQKADIWKAREVTFSAADRLTPVTVAIWDEGSDLSLFPGRAFVDRAPAKESPYTANGLAFDIDWNPSTGYLRPLSPARAAEYPTIVNDLKGFSDLQQSVDSPEADALRAKIAALSTDQVPRFEESLSYFGGYVHGTHVAGIAARGDPAIRIAVARHELDWRIIPALPTEALAHRTDAAYQTIVDWFRGHGVRVVNMSWGGDAASWEATFEANGVGKDAAERKMLGRHFFELDRNALFAALKSAPDILFVCSAGNANVDNAFDEFYPSSFVLPNLLVVGAVDQAGDEASFTSYGKNVVVDANGYQVDSVVPGGRHLQLSGTSMASPNVVNLAAKLIALDPKLTPTDTIKLIVAGATPGVDGRRHNIDPAKSVALLISTRN